MSKTVTASAAGSHQKLVPVKPRWPNVCTLALGPADDCSRFAVEAEAQRAARPRLDQEPERAGVEPAFVVAAQRIE
ncbi:MAG: hypothetical protein QM756_30640 [Polyangiaceae bacterium]